MAETMRVTLQTPDGPTPAYHVTPGRGAPGAVKGAVVVLQGAFGVNDHIGDVCHQFTTAGYLAVAPQTHRS